MAAITKVLVIVALACMVNALPLGEQEQEAQANLLSVDEVPQQDASAVGDASVRQKRHGFGYGGYGFGYPAYVSYGGYGGYGGGYGGYGGYGYPAYGYGGYSPYGYGGYGYGGGLWG